MAGRLFALRGDLSDDERVLAGALERPGGGYACSRGRSMQTRRPPPVAFEA
jgi:hypothetical protein